MVYHNFHAKVMERTISVETVNCLLCGEDSLVLPRFILFGLNFDLKRPLTIFVTQIHYFNTLVSTF